MAGGISQLGLQLSIRQQLLRRNVERFRGGLVFKAHRPLHRSTPGLRVKKKKEAARGAEQEGISEQLLRRNVKRIRRGLVFKARRLLYRSTLGLKVINQKKRPGNAIGARAAQEESAEVRQVPDVRRDCPCQPSPSALRVVEWEQIAFFHACGLHGGAPGSRCQAG